jgi:uncharacterized Zn finger protein
MATRIVNLECTSCGHQWEYLYHATDDGPGVQCPKCAAINENPVEVFPMPLVTKTHDPERKKEILMKRSAEDTAKHVRSVAGHRGTLPPGFGTRRQR